jgi:hypothetical protein
MGKQSGKTRERIDAVYGTVNAPDGTITLHYDFECDAIELVGADPGSTRTERRYERESGKPKVVTSIPSDRSSPFTAQRALFAYERVVAIDTNHRTVDGKRCAVCFSYYVPEPPSSYKTGVPYLPLGAFLITGILEGVNPERIGWHLTLGRYLANYRPSHGRLAVVVDSELSLHKAINTREVGYYGAHLLPENSSLVYASSDVDKDTLQGSMIRLCDAGAKTIFDEYAKRGGLPALSANSTDSNFEAFAEIKFRREQPSNGH